MGQEKGYNGWTNYQTWATALWIDNDEGTQDIVNEMAADAWQDSAQHENVRSGVWTREQAARFTLADRLEEFVREEMIPDLGATLPADLLGAAVSEVDFREIAEHYLDEVDKEEDEEPQN